MYELKCDKNESDDEFQTHISTISAQSALSNVTMRAGANSDEIITLAASDHSSNVPLEKT